MFESRNKDFTHTILRVRAHTQKSLLVKERGILQEIWHEVAKLGAPSILSIHSIRIVPSRMVVP